MRFSTCDGCVLHEADIICSLRFFVVENLLFLGNYVKDFVSFYFSAENHAESVLSSRHVQFFI